MVNKFEKWWTEDQKVGLDSGDYSMTLQEFDFIHSSLPQEKDVRDCFVNFYLGNGNIGMIIDPFGAQAAPYVIDSNINYEYRDGIDQSIGEAKSIEFDSEPYIYRRNILPCINTIDNWATAPAEFKNTRGRGKFSMRCSAFPIIDGVFNPNRIQEYNQRLDLWNNKCITRFVYDGMASVAVTSFTSWDNKRLAVFNIKITNISNQPFPAGSVIEPIAYFKEQRLDFVHDGKVLLLSHADQDLLYDTAVCAGVCCNGNMKYSAVGKLQVEQILSPGETQEVTVYWIMQNTYNTPSPLQDAQSGVSMAMDQQYIHVLSNHEEKVHQFWKKWWVLLPWKNLCKVYYRNALICAGQLNGGRWYPAISTLANSSYSGGGWGMDNVPLYDFMMQIGHAPVCKNVLSLFADVLPEDPEHYGSQFNYSFDDNPLSRDQICNSSGNYAWLMYAYFRYTQDETFLREKAYPVMQSMCDFWSGYANDAGGYYGFWTRQKYAGKTWYLHTYDEMAHKYSNSEYGYAESDNIIDVIAPAKYMLQKTIELAEQLGESPQRIDRWKECDERLQIPQNDLYYLGFGGKDYIDPLPMREWMTCSIFNTIYPTVCKIDYEKLERTYHILKEHSDETGMGLHWHFNYNQQLWDAVARMRMPEELQWLMAESKLNLEDSLGFDGMTFFECNPSQNAGYFMMPYAMINVTVNDMLLQSYDGVIRVFPCVLPDFGVNPVEFSGLAAFDGFNVSAQMNKGKTSCVYIESHYGNRCKVEVPMGWRAVHVTDTTDGKSVELLIFDSTIRINRMDETVRILEFDTIPGRTYHIRE